LEQSGNYFSELFEECFDVCWWLDIRSKFRRRYEEDQSVVISWKTAESFQQELEKQ